MLLGRVIGQLVATRKHVALDGQKLLLIRPYGAYELSHHADVIVAVDPIGAGPGEDVVICFGEPARRCSREAVSGSLDLPVEAAVMAIVDRTQIDRASVAGLRRPLDFGPAAPGALPASAEWV
jgi:ethanolamine utilization protein EutN